jgi:hypothetical protein
MITYVTAFFQGKRMKRSIEEYKQEFDKLVATGIKLVLFLDSDVHWIFPDNVHVYPASLEDTWVYQTIQSPFILPTPRGEHDSLEYLQIQNSKVEWLYRATLYNPWKTEWFAWIDFGITHVFKKPEETLERLKQLQPPTTACIRTAGIWSHRGGYEGAVCWRFAGGFLLLHHAYAKSFMERCHSILLRKKPYFSWEVNVWAELESEGVQLGWYASDHNDSIIPFTNFA